MSENQNILVGGGMDECNLPLITATIPRTNEARICLSNRTLRLNDCAKPINIVYYWVQVQPSPVQFSSDESPA